MNTFVQSPAFARAKTYRVLRGGDAKLGMYLLLKAGGHLDSEFFPESGALHNFADRSAYERLLCARNVDVVLVFHSYDVTRRTNEHERLRELTRSRESVSASVMATLGGYEGYEAFAIDRRGCPL